ncbi:MAG: undecaprenyl-phosphate glucose phosphotransferase [Hyphomicrobiales bacterium]|nr:undecaprenyl-phosphate glucose phosphotransferase [Hyphomicrobiales bacterium]
MTARTDKGKGRLSVLSEQLIPGLLQISDAAIIGLSGAAAYSIYRSGSIEIPLQYGAAMAAMVALFIYLARRADLYRVETITAWPRRMGRLFIIMVTVFLLMTALSFSLKLQGQFSRIWVSSTFSSATVLLIASRGVILYFLRRWGAAKGMGRSIAVVGGGLQAECFLMQFRGSGSLWHKIVGIFDDRVERLSSKWLDYPVLGNLNDLVKYVRRGEVSTVVITIPWSADRRLRGIVSELSELPVDIYLGSDLVGYQLQRMSKTLLGGVSVYEVAAIPISDWAAVVKTLEDKVLSAILLLIFSPVLLLVALAIKLDTPGPVIFRQRRYGFNNEAFLIRKFRTMYHSDQAEREIVQAKRNDPRVTRVGRLLRRTSLDELPQLIDVFLGTMSLIGPRPHAVEHDEYYEALIQGYKARQKVKPGMTGWAQVNGLRGETEAVEHMQARVAHDIYYIENWSFWLDIKILVMTLFVGWYHNRE